MMKIGDVVQILFPNKAKKKEMKRKKGKPAHNYTSKKSNISYEEGLIKYLLIDVLGLWRPPTKKP